MELSTSIGSHTQFPYYDTTGRRAQWLAGRSLSGVRVATVCRYYRASPSRLREGLRVERASEQSRPEPLGGSRHDRAVRRVRRDLV